MRAYSPSTEATFKGIEEAPTRMDSKEKYSGIKPPKMPRVPKAKAMGKMSEDTKLARPKIYDMDADQLEMSGKGSFSPGKRGAKEKMRWNQMIKRKKKMGY